MFKVITFLGAPHSYGGEYVTTQYGFEDGSVSEPTAFFGVALFRWLQTRKHVDEVLFVGTRGAIWDSLLELSDQIDEAAWCELSDAVSEGRVTEERLEMLEIELERYLDTKVRCVMLETGFGRTEQLELLDTVSGFLGDNDEVAIDFTHSYRHYGPLAIQSASFLQQVRDVRIDGVFYGAFAAQKDGVAPVCRLKAVAELAEWGRAIAVFHETGALGALPSVVREEHPELESPLRSLSFGLATSQFDVARAAAHQVSSSIRNILKSGTTTVTGLFLPVLLEATEPLAQSHLADWQLHVAQRSLAKGNFTRAAIMAYEAIHSAAIADEDKRTDRSERDKYQQAWSSGEQRFTDFGVDGQKYYGLRNLRNALAHGSGGHNAFVQRGLSSSESLHKVLGELLEMAAEIVEKFKASPPDIPTTDW